MWKFSRSDIVTETHVTHFNNYLIDKHLSDVKKSYISWSVVTTVNKYIERRISEFRETLDDLPLIYKTEFYVEVTIDYKFDYIIKYDLKWKNDG